MKRKKFYRSKYQFPTRIVRASQSSGTLVLGHKKAREDVERTIRRPLHPDTKVRTAGGNWVFIEPKKS